MSQKVSGRGRGDMHQFHTIESRGRPQKELVPRGTSHSAVPRWLEEKWKPASKDGAGVKP